LIPARVGGDDKATSEAVPPRPRESGTSKPVKASAKVKTLAPEKSAPAASNGHASNGSASNGRSQSTLDGSSDDASTQVSGTITVSQKNGKPGNADGSGSSQNGSSGGLNGSRARRRRRF
jgi:hypothetical protein